MGWCAAAWLLIGVLAGCGQHGGPRSPDVADDPSPAVRSEPPPTPPLPPTPPPPPPPPAGFQAAFALALHHSISVGEVTTWRLRVPVTRAGTRVRVALRAGDGPMELIAATIARDSPSPSTALSAAPVALTFGGKPGARVDARERAVSDPLAFPVERLEELWISFEARGDVARSAIVLTPGGRVGTGRHSHRLDAFGREHTTPVGLVEIAVEGPPGRAVAALGDSITEGYTDGVQDYRAGWPFLVAKALGVPVNNVAVSGSAVNQERERLASEVFTLAGITDCFVLIGTNDVPFRDVEDLRARIAALYAALEPFCRVWGATLPPREESKQGAPIAVIRARVRELNAWIREEAPVEGVFDFNRVLADPERPELFRDAFDEDGVHPNDAGQRAMAEEVTRVLTARGWKPPE